MSYLLLPVGFALGCILMYLYYKSIFGIKCGGTLIVKDGFQEGIIESINLRFSIPEDEISNSERLYFRVKHERS